MKQDQARYADPMNKPLILTVTQLNQQVHYLLEQSFPYLSIQGEISNLIRASSGHWYFSLKDSSAQVRCAMFRGKNLKVKAPIDNGMQVLVTAKVSLYQPRGDYQLIVESLEELGQGQLQREFERLKLKLQKAGLFDAEQKQALPLFPNCIGVITSPTGAAIRDILRVLKRRMPCIPIIVYPTLVQGQQAADQLVTQIQNANHHQKCDVIILARGGGSLEDLWPFNEERVAQAIFNSDIPIIAGIGHEIDFTIADFVADIRAATPSAAAELVSPDQFELQQTLDQHQLRLIRLVKQSLQQNKQQLSWLAKRLLQAHPKQTIAQQHEQLNYYQQRLNSAINTQLQIKHQELQTLYHQLQINNPRDQLYEQQHRLVLQKQQLNTAIKQCLANHQQRLAKSAQALHLTSPLATLARGYGIILNAKTGRVIRDKNDITTGEKIIAKLEKLELSCTVNSYHNTKN